MVWAILFLLGIPLWFIVIGIAATVMRNRKLRARLGNIPARVKRPGKTRWTAWERGLDLGRVRVPRKSCRLERGHRPGDGRGAA